MDDICPDCYLAAKELHHGFRMGCRGCAARAVSRGPNYRRVRQAGALDRQYRGELDALGVTHDEVKAAAAADAIDREAA